MWLEIFTHQYFYVFPHVYRLSKDLSAKTNTMGGELYLTNSYELFMKDSLSPPSGDMTIFAYSL